MRRSFGSWVGLGAKSYLLCEKPVFFFTPFHQCNGAFLYNISLFQFPSKKKGGGGLDNGIATIAWQ